MNTLRVMVQTNPDAAVHVGPDSVMYVGGDPRVEEFLEVGLLVVVQTEHGPALFVPFGEGRVVPLQFSYSGTGGPVDWRMLVQVTAGEPARCVALELRAPKGRHILAETLRNIPLGDMLEEALLMSAYEVDDAGRLVGSIADRATTPAQARKLHERIAREHRRRLRGERTQGRVTPELLAEVGRVYRANMVGRRPGPVAAVQGHFKVSRSTAGRWVGLARDAGELGKAPGRGVAGERPKRGRN